MKVDSELLNLLGNGSIAIIVFVMWYLSFKQFNKQQAKVSKENQANVDRMFCLLEEDIKYKDALNRILSRLEIKLDVSIHHKERNII